MEKVFPENNYVGCVVLTHHRKILLQKRGEDWKHFPGYIAEFGGHIEVGESPVQAIIRELQEELGAEIKEDELVYFGAILETNSHDRIFCFLWYDAKHTITGCYEGEAVTFEDVQSILKQPKITEGLRWLLGECKKQNLLS